MSELLTFIDPDGTVVPLTYDNGIIIALRIEGFGMPPVEIVREEVPYRPGSRKRRAKLLERELVIPVTIFGATPEAARAKINELERLFDPDRGDGIMRRTRLDGTVREVVASYNGGLEMIEDSPATQIVAVLVFWCGDPLFSDTEDTTMTAQQSAVTDNFFPILPLLLSPDFLTGEFIVDNSGDAETWPVWRINGPGSDPTLTNQTTNRALSLTGLTLLQSEALIIDTRPDAKTVKLDDGTNKFSTMDPQSELWPLEVGTNEISLAIADATEDTILTLEYRRRWLGA